MQYLTTRTSCSLGYSISCKHEQRAVNLILILPFRLGIKKNAHSGGLIIRKRSKFASSSKFTHGSTDTTHGEKETEKRRQEKKEKKNHWGVKYDFVLCCFYPKLLPAANNKNLALSAKLEANTQKLAGLWLTDWLTARCLPFELTSARWNNKCTEKTNKAHNPMLLLMLKQHTCDLIIGDTS